MIDKINAKPSLEQEYDELEKNYLPGARKIYKWAWSIWVAFVVLRTTALGGIVYVAVHFIRKYWNR